MGFGNVSSATPDNATLDSNAGLLRIKGGLGTALQQLRTNSGANAVEWFTPSSAVSYLDYIGTANLDGGAAASIAISSIASGYKILKGVLYTGNASTTNDIKIELNDDATATNYFTFRNSFSSVSNTALTNGLTNSTTPVDYIEFEIFQLSTTGYKFYKLHGYRHSDGSAKSVFQTMGVWIGNAEITKVEFVPVSQNLAQNSVMFLWGFDIA